MIDQRDINSVLSNSQKQVLEELVRASYVPKVIAMRAKIILLYAEGKPSSVIRDELRISYPPIYKWQERWEQAKASLDQIESEKTKHELKISIENTLKDARRSGAPSTFTEMQVLQIIALACTPPKDENLPVSHWSCRLLAEHARQKGIVKNISHSQINFFLKSGANKAAQGKMLVKF
jgi:putative transposase